MALKIIEETLDSVDAPFHSLYTEQDGKFVLTGVEGLKTQEDINRLTVSLTKERNDHKATKEKYAPIVALGKDPNEIVSLIDRIPELEELAKGKIDDTKIEQIVETRLKAKLTPVERALEAEKQRATLFEQENKTFKERERTGKIHDALRKAAIETKIRPEAVDDALLLAERYFELDETGVVIGKSDMSGVSPGIDPIAWFIENQSKRPYLWGDSFGGGAGGSGNNFAGVVNPWTADNWNLTEQGKILQANPKRAEQLAASAGTTIGGKKPIKK